MIHNQGKLFIGTSGWVYPDWLGIFYPKDLPSKDKLKYFSKHFKTAEINYSFYRLPRPAIYQKWYSETPDDFLFSVKVSRFITHIKRLMSVALKKIEGGRKQVHLPSLYGRGEKISKEFAFHLIFLSWRQCHFNKR